MNEVWFKFLIKNKKYWCVGFTLKRLERVKQHVFSDDDVMWDLLNRHYGAVVTPEQMKEEDPENFKRAITNLASSTLFIMVDKGIYKI